MRSTLNVVRPVHGQAADNDRAGLPGLEREVGRADGQALKTRHPVEEFEQKITEITPFLNVPADLNLYHGYKRFTTFPATYPAKQS